MYFTHGHQSCKIHSLFNFKNWPPCTDFFKPSLRILVKLKLVKLYFIVKKKNITLFENYSKCRIWNFQPIFVLLKLTCVVTLFDRKLQFFKNSPKSTIFGIFNELLSTRNVNVARFARNVECDFLAIFKHCVLFYVCQ